MLSWWNWHTLYFFGGGQHTSYVWHWKAWIFVDVVMPCSFWSPSERPFLAWSTKCVVFKTVLVSLHPALFLVCLSLIRDINWLIDLFANSFYILLKLVGLSSHSTFVKTSCGQVSGKRERTLYTFFCFQGLLHCVLLSGWVLWLSLLLLN